MTTTAEILQKARDLISDEKNWTVEDYVCQIEGRTCFCALGALARVQELDPEDNLPGASELALIVTGGTDTLGFHVARFNDSHTHAEVLDLFDRAIKRAISAEEAA